MKSSDPLTSHIIKCCYQVHQTLGSGFLEKVYQNALSIELRKVGLAHRVQAPIHVFYEQQVVGEFYADILVGNEVVLELKTVKTLAPEHSAQLINYLAATRISTGLLINFQGPKPEIKRLFSKPTD